MDLALRIGQIFEECGIPPDWRLQKLHSSVLTALLDAEDVVGTGISAAAGGADGSVHHSNQRRATDATAFAEFSVMGGGRPMSSPTFRRSTAMTSDGRSGSRGRGNSPEANDRKQQQQPQRERSGVAQEPSLSSFGEGGANEDGAFAPTSPLSPLRQRGNRTATTTSPSPADALRAPADDRLSVDGVEAHNMLLRNLLHQQAKKWAGERALLVRENGFLRAQALALSNKVARAGETAVSMMPPSSAAATAAGGGGIPSSPRQPPGSPRLPSSPSLSISHSASFSAGHLDHDGGASTANATMHYSVATATTTENAVDDAAQYVLSSERLVHEVEQHRSAASELRKRAASEARRRVQEVGELARRLAEVQRGRAAERDELKKSVAQLTREVEAATARIGGLSKENARLRAELDAANLGVERQRAVAVALEQQLARARTDIDGLVEGSNRQLSVHQEQVLNLKREAKSAAKGLEHKCHELARRNLEMARRLQNAEAQSQTMQQRARDSLLHRRGTMMMMASSRAPQDGSENSGDPSLHRQAPAGGAGNLIAALSDTRSALYDPVMAGKLSVLEETLTVKQDELDETKEKLIALEMELASAKQGDATAEMLLRETERQLQFERERMTKAMLEMARTEAELRDALNKTMGSADAFEDEDIEKQQRELDKQKKAQAAAAKAQAAAAAAAPAQQQTSPASSSAANKTREQRNAASAAVIAEPVVSFGASNSSSNNSGDGMTAEERRRKKRQEQEDQYSPAAVINYITTVVNRTSSTQTDPVKFAADKDASGGKKGGRAGSAGKRGGSAGKQRSASDGGESAAPADSGGRPASPGSAGKQRRTTFADDGEQEQQQQQQRERQALEQQRKEMEQQAAELKAQQQRLGLERSALDMQRRAFEAERQTQTQQQQPQQPLTRSSSGVASPPASKSTQTQHPGSDVDLSASGRGLGDDDPERVQRRNQLLALQNATAAADRKRVEAEAKEKQLAEFEASLVRRAQELDARSQEAVAAPEAKGVPQPVVAGDNGAAVVGAQPSSGGGSSPPLSLSLAAASVQTDLDSAALDAALLALRAPSRGEDPAAQQSSARAAAAAAIARERRPRRSIGASESNVSDASSASRVRAAAAVVSRGCSPIAEALLAPMSAFGGHGDQYRYQRQQFGSEDAPEMVPGAIEQSDFACQVDLQHRPFFSARASRHQITAAAAAASSHYTPPVHRFLLDESESASAADDAAHSRGQHKKVGGGSGAEASPWVPLPQRELQLEVHGEPMTIHATTLGGSGSTAPFGAATPTLSYPRGAGMAAAASSWHFQQQQQKALAAFDVAVREGGPSPSVVLDSQQRHGTGASDHDSSAAAPAAFWGGVELVSAALRQRHQQARAHQAQEAGSSADAPGRRSPSPPATATSHQHELLDVSIAIRDGFRGENASSRRRGLPPHATPPPPPQTPSSTFTAVTPELAKQQQAELQQWVAHSGAASTAPRRTAPTPSTRPPSSAPADHPHQHQHQHQPPQQQGLFWTSMETHKRLTKGQQLNERLVKQQQQQQQQQQAPVHASTLPPAGAALWSAQCWSTEASGDGEASGTHRNHAPRAMSPTHARQMGAGAATTSSPSQRRSSPQRGNATAAATETAPSGRALEYDQSPPAPMSLFQPSALSVSPSSVVAGNNASQNDDGDDGAVIAVSQAANAVSVTSSVKNLLRRRSVALAKSEAGFSSAHDHVDGRDVLRMTAVAASTKALSRRDLQCLATVEKAAKDRKVAQFLATFDASQFAPQRNSTIDNAVMTVKK